MGLSEICAFGKPWKCRTLEASILTFKHSYVITDWKFCNFFKVTEFLRSFQVSQHPARAWRGHCLIVILLFSVFGLVQDDRHSLFGRLMND